MRRQIAGRLYDTDKARKVASHEDGDLYQKRTGEWFLYDGDIRPMRYDEAFRWADGRLSDEQLLGVVSAVSGDSTKRVTVALKRDAYAILKREAAERGTTLTKVIEHMAWRLDAERDARPEDWREALRNGGYDE